MKTAIAAAVCSLASLAFVGCASSSQEEVTSTYRSQRTFANADVKATTEAAKGVLEEMDLKSVTSTSTNVDGKAMGKQADGTEINVVVDRDGDEKSNIRVTVGLTGDPKLGAEIAKKTKNRAEGGGGDPTTRRSTGNTM